MTTSDPGSQEQTPLFSVVRGTPTDEEIAALVAVLSARRSATTGPPPRQQRSGWSAYARSIRTPPHPGPGVWRMSGRG